MIEGMIEDFMQKQQVEISALQDYENLCSIADRLIEVEDNRLYAEKLEEIKNLVCNKKYLLCFYLFTHYGFKYSTKNTLAFFNDIERIQGSNPTLCCHFTDIFGDLNLSLKYCSFFKDIQSMLSDTGVMLVTNSTVGFSPLLLNLFFKEKKDLQIFYFADALTFLKKHEQKSLFKFSEDQKDSIFNYGFSNSEINKIVKTEMKNKVAVIKKIIQTNPLEYQRFLYAKELLNEE